MMPGAFDTRAFMILLRMFSLSFQRRRLLFSYISSRIYEIISRTLPSNIYEFLKRAISPRLSFSAKCKDTRIPDQVSHRVLPRPPEVRARLRAAGRRDGGMSLPRLPLPTVICFEDYRDNVVKIFAIYRYPRSGDIDYLPVIDDRVQ